MEIIVFSKKRKSQEGRPFTTYLTSLTKKDGTRQTMQLKFKDETPKPNAADCPMYINVDKNNANISKSTYKRRDTGEDSVSFTLWVSEWAKSDRIFTDDSLDEYEV